MNENTFSTYELLDKMRARPVLYLGELSITRLSWYVAGYRQALLSHGFEEVTEPQLLDKFCFWVRARLHQDQKGIGWAESILEACNGDEAQAFERFYEMLDEYRCDRFPGLVERWAAEWDAVLEAEWAAEEEQEAKGE